MSLEFEKKTKKTFRIKNTNLLLHYLAQGRGLSEIRLFPLLTWRCNSWLLQIAFPLWVLDIQENNLFAMCWRSIKSLLEICQLQAVHAVKSVQAKQGNPTPTSMSRLRPRYNWDIVFMDSKPCRNNFNECCTSGPPEHYYLVKTISGTFIYFFSVDNCIKGILSNFCHHCHVIVFINYLF